MVAAQPLPQLTVKAIVLGLVLSCRVARASTVSFSPRVSAMSMKHEIASWIDE